MPVKTLILNSFESFWRPNPALLYGIAILIGFSFFLTRNPILILPALLLLFSGKRAILAYALIIISALFLNSQISLPHLDPEGIKGEAYFDISGVSLKSSHFGKQWIYKGTIKSLDLQRDIKNIPVSISIPLKQDILRPPADKSYFIKGTLKEISHEHYTFILEKNAPWIEITNTWSFAEIRFQLKDSLKKCIHQKIKDDESATFLSGIATGEFDDRLMAFHFSRFGLQHIMAISGFHFAIITAILRAALQLIFSKKTATIILITLITAYCIFLGFAPSILRAWLMILIVLFGFLLKKSSVALNSMGFALIVVLLVDPMMVRHIGFQFSFLTTASILLFYSTADTLLQKIFFKRFLYDVVEMNLINQHGFVILTAIRQASALCLAVNICALPLMLFHFEHYPYLSIIYNFFFPFMVSISMLLLIIGLAIPFLPFIHSINSTFTQFLLKFTYDMPQTIDYNLTFRGFSVEGVIIYLCFLFCTGVLLHYKQEQRREMRLDFAYL